MKRFDLMMRNFGLIIFIIDAFFLSFYNYNNKEGDLEICKKMNNHASRNLGEILHETNAKG
jgi:hypothetical protein